MPGCTFCDGHSTVELNVYEKQIGAQIQVPLCDECTKKYDGVVERFK